MANSVDPNQTAPIGAVCSESTLFASILYSSVMLDNYFQMHFFLGAIRVKPYELIILLNRILFLIQPSLFE